jgi:hypothetical protein
MRMLRTTMFGVVAALAVSSAAYAGSITLTGPTTMAGTYTPAALAALGAANPSEVVTSGTLTGISLWGLLGGAAASSPTSPIYGDITARRDRRLQRRRPERPLVARRQRQHRALVHERDAGVVERSHREHFDKLDAAERQRRLKCEKGAA